MQLMWSSLIIFHYLWGLNSDADTITMMIRSAISKSAGTPPPVCCLYAETPKVEDGPDRSLHP